jgi:hypothetical protein
MIWQAYVDPVWGYSINLPADWHEITAGEWHSVNQNNAALDRYTRAFSDEAVAAAGSLPLDDSGVVFTLGVIPVNSCSAVDASQSSFPALGVSIDGVASVVVGNYGFDQTRTWRNVVAQVGLGRYCFYFVGFTTALATRDSFLKVFTVMLGSFHRGSPASPPF